MAASHVLPVMSQYAVLVASALDELPHASFIVFDTDLRYVLTRGSALADNGVLPSDLEGRLAAESLPAERWAFYEPLYRAALAGASSEISITSPDGLKSYVVRVGPVAAPGGAIVGGVAVATDVTEQAQAARALESSERRFRTAMHGAAVGTALVDSQGRFEEVNDALCTILGYPREELLGRTFAEITHPEDVELSRAGLAGLQSGNLETFRIRKRYLTRLSHVVWVDVTANALRGDDGTFLGTVTQMVDVTVEVEELAALAASESRYRLLVENIAEVVFHQADGIVVWISPSVQALLGWTPEDLIGSATVDMWHPEDRRAAVVMREAAYAGEPGEAVLRFRHKDGRYLWLEVAMRPAEGGEHGGMVGTLRDVSKRIEAEAALAASEHQFRLLAENASDVVALVAVDGAITWVSPSASRTLGWDPAHLVGRHGRDFVHPDDLHRWSEAAGAVMRGEARALEYRFRRPDGAYLWVSVLSSPIVDPDGHARGRVVSLRDVDASVRARLLLQESEERFRLAMDNSAAGMSLVSPTGAFLRVNAALCEFLDRTRDELLSLTWTAVTHPDDLARDLPLVQDVLQGRRDSLRLRKRYLRPDGSVVWGDLAMGPVRNNDGSVRYMVVQVIDATDHVLAERTLAEQTESLRAVLDNSRDGISRFDPQLRVEFINQRGVDLSGIPRANWLGRTLDELGYPSHITENWNAHIASVFATGESDVFEYQVDNTEGTRWYEASLSAEFGSDGSVAHVISANRDITDRHRAEDELRHLATHDPLTTLANRTAIGDEIDRSLRAGRRTSHATAVLMVDLDRFQYVNDSLGHRVGDDLLRAAGDRIAGSVRGGDLVGRMGGDEFCVVMRDLEDPAEALTAAWRLVTDFRASFLIGAEEVFTTASIGVTVSSGHAGAQDLLREADTALFVAKGEGRDRVSVFNDDLRAAVTTRLRLEGELRHALERGELAVWYQPEINLTTGAMIAVEALLRWHHPSGELYGADRFVDLAEETGLILDIGPWVLHQACTQAQAWATGRPGTPLTVRVNASALQLADAGLLPSLDDALATSGLDPGVLCVEITETALLRETQTAHDNLEGIRRRGIRIAVDDFGTGYASLTYLRQYPVDVLKIDRSFVTDIATDEHDRRLVAGIVALSDTLGMTVTAEGVETPEQAAILREMGCPGAQGYLYSRAVPAEEITRNLDTEYPRP